jgi:hypothetical protein
MHLQVGRLQPSHDLDQLDPEGKVVGGVVRPAMAVRTDNYYCCRMIRPSIRQSMNMMHFEVELFTAGAKGCRSAAPFAYAIRASQSIQPNSLAPQTISALPLQWIAQRRRGRSAAPIPAGSPGHRREPSPTRTATRTTTSKVVYYAGRRIGVMTPDGRVQLDSNAHIPG